MQSIHQQLVAHLQLIAAARAVVRDVSTAGAEEVQILIDVGGDDDITVLVGETPVNPMFGRLTLHLLLISQSPLFWLSATPRKKPLPPTGFGHWLKAKIEGLLLSRVSSGASGRILRLEFGGAEPSAESQLILVLDPLTNGCRVLTLTPSGEVEQRFPAPIHASASGRGTPGSVYQEPAGDYTEIWQEWLSPLPPGEKTNNQLLQVYHYRFARGSVRSRTGQPLFLAPVGPLSPGVDGIEPFPSPVPPLTAARMVGLGLIASQRRYQAVKTMGQAVKGENKHLRRLNNRLTRELEEARGGEQLRRQAEALLSNPTIVPKGASTYDLPNPANPAETITVELNPALGFAANAARMFKKAGKLERALSIREDKQQRITIMLSELEAFSAILSEPMPFDPTADLFPIEMPNLKEGIQQLRTPLPGIDPGLDKRRRALADRLKGIYKSLNSPQEQVGFEARRSGMPDHDGASRGRSAFQSPEEKPEGWGPTDAAAERAGIHPRRFILPDGWIVLVGRTNTENDTLTHRAARQKDLWFHARGVAGSHVVLQRGDRKDNPSRKTLEMTAAIAAFHSKAKTSGLAPVVYTEKRYVRKPRKAPPGLAVCIREKVIMAKPAVPEAPSPERGSD
jgi:NFACT N-terminal and middle domains/NFACT protein RNA binding domain